MKKIILVLAIALETNAMSAQTNTPVGVDENGINPPTTVSTKFQTDYPNINATWVMNGDNYSAEYKDVNTNMKKSIIYDTNGNIVSNNNEIGIGNYPGAIGDYYTKNYPKDIFTVWSSDDGSGNKSYYAKGKENILWFDKDGKYMSKKPISNSKKTKTIK